MIQTKSVFSLALSFLLVAIGSKASADTSVFYCSSVDQDTQVQVFFETNDVGGQKLPFVTQMIWSDPNVQPANQHIATFYARDGILKNFGATIVATVDLTKPESSRAGERIGGTRLGALDAIVLEIDFSYTEPVQDGENFAGVVTYKKKNGKELSQDFDCTHKGHNTFILK